VCAVAIAASAGLQKAVSEHLLLTGAADGQGRLWRLTAHGNIPPPLMLGQTHEGAIRAVAFHPNGLLCVTGGEDKRIGIWEIATGKLVRWLQVEEGLPPHQGTVTSLHFAPDGYLVSAGRDNVVKVWNLQSEGELVRVHPGRTGDVTNPGLSPDGRRVLFDLGDELRILDRDGGTCLGSLRNRNQGRFQGFAQFSPTGRLILTASSNARLQLWRSPATPEETLFFRQGYTQGFHRGSLLALGPLGGATGWAGLLPTPQLWQLLGQEVRHFLVPNASVVNCGTFAPDESAFFTGGADKTVRVWAIPPMQRWNQTSEARITYIGSQVERGTDRVRIRAEMANPDDPGQRLRSGLHAVMRLFPEAASLK
jgi:WD40 repeat protein